MLDNPTGVSVLPGATAEHIHIDHPPLFAEGLTQMVRPIICMVYSRPWFTDCRNFSRQAKLRMSAADLADVPGEFRPVLARASES